MDIYFRFREVNSAYPNGFINLHLALLWIAWKGFFPGIRRKNPYLLSCRQFAILYKVCGLDSIKSFPQYAFSYTSYSI
ncbi:hypothetical protein TREPR_2275 [Treponema primitia ZAS-2]|uniref:Uncharacterized protein n=1 Tax=Treponema primitia (strain ATCC BAA-887 / DSM 12427 / ZAS-2) TaxID=545694 RepID=F5YID5_TREPZ|nr:hypothetical protein TREPR_2275 [Treponema primitia ZAS-2]